MRKFSDHRFTVFLLDDLAAYLEDEKARTGLGSSAILRQALALRRTHQQRTETTIDELFSPVETGAY